MIKWYRSEIKGATWCIAENWRFLASYNYGYEQIKSLGKVLSFTGRQLSSVLPSGKFFRALSRLTLKLQKPSLTKLTMELETEWRKNPTHQGGFLLDSGVHYMAGLRKLLEAVPGNEIDRISAYSTQHRDYLPPVDSANVIFKTRSGATGNMLFSVASSTTADEWTVECEKGWIKIENSKVTISRDGKVEELNVPNERTGVPPEVRAWGEALSAGNVLKEQEPEAALADLELVSKLNLIPSPTRLD